VCQDFIRPLVSWSTSSGSGKESLNSYLRLISQTYPSPFGIIVPYSTPERRRGAVVLVMVMTVQRLVLYLGLRVVRGSCFLTLLISKARQSELLLIGENRPWDTGANIACCFVDMPGFP